LILIILKLPKCYRTVPHKKKETMLNYCPDSMPSVDPRQIQEAANFNLKPVYVICNDPQDEAAGTTFFAFVQTVPKIGEVLLLQDKKNCLVKGVIHKVSIQGESKFPVMMPIVVSEWISPETLEALEAVDDDD